ncbi:MAG: dihydrodipicolinate synthase family protein [Planctomycetes bacterium]|nr:dihydrodipicolinate synthase family protein [Planctomycetota bacterium]
MSTSLSGVFPILVTPFDEAGRLDAASLERLIDFCLRCRVHGLGVFGLAGEFYKLTAEERRTVLDTVIRRVDRRVPVVVGTGGPSGEIAALNSREAESAGADAVLVIPLFVTGGGPESLYAYFKAVSESVSIPIMVQDAPTATVGPMPIALLARMARELPHLGYVKEEASPAGPRITAIRKEAGDALRVFAGSGNLYAIDALDRGAVGLMPGPGLADFHVRLYERYAAGAVHEAFQEYQRLLPILVHEATCYIPLVKEALVHRGVIRSSRLREPAGPLPDHLDVAYLARLLQELGL